MLRSAIFGAWAMLFVATGCNDDSHPVSGPDSPGVIQPRIMDSSAIKIVPPANDSNVVNPDTAGISR